MFVHILWMSLICTMSLGCKQRRSSSAEIKVRDGIETDLYPTVMRLSIAKQGICTTELIEPGVFLTAAHCLFDEQDRLRRPEDFVIQQTKVSQEKETIVEREFKVEMAIPHPRYNATENTKRQMRYDLALLYVPEARRLETSPLRVCNRKAESGEQVTMVGYGLNDRFKDERGKAGVKRVGYNHVLNVYDGAILMRGKTTSFYESDSTTPTGEGAGSAKGDSGGPLLAPCGMVGVTSWGHDERSSITSSYRDSRFVDLSDIQGIEFLSSSVAAYGWHADQDQSWGSVYTERSDAYLTSFEEALRLCYHHDFVKRYRLATIDELEASAANVASTMRPGCVWSSSVGNAADGSMATWTVAGGRGVQKRSERCQAFCVRQADPKN